MPVHLVGGSLEVPVHKDVSSRVAIANCVAVRQQQSPLAKVNAEVGEWLVQCSCVAHLASHKILCSPLADRGCKGVHLSDCMRVVEHAGVAERT